jgi:multisubunit Na+/H+ antiporter MnhF subunit
MRYHVNVFVTQTMIEGNWLPSRCLAMDALLFFISVVTVCLERRYDKYVSKGCIKTHSNVVFC